MNQEKQKNIAKYVQETNHYRDQYEPQPSQFFLHGDPQTPPQVPARKTWSQQQQAPKQPEMSSWSQHAQQNKFDTMSWKPSSPSQQQKPQDSFVLHHQNGRDSHSEAQRLFPVVHANLKLEPSNTNMSSDDMMAPQSISFIGDDEGNDEDEADNFQRKNGDQLYRQVFNHKMDDLEVSLGKLNITSGSRTYRIPSPTTRNHPGIAGNSFQSMDSQHDNEAENEKGFYISFDNATAPKRPKPPLRKNRLSKKSGDDFNNSQPELKEVVSKKAFEALESHKSGQSEASNNDIERPRYSGGVKPTPAQALIIENNETNSDPVSISITP